MRLVEHSEGSAHRSHSQLQFCHWPGRRSAMGRRNLRSTQYRRELLLAARIGDVLDHPGNAQGRNEALEKAGV